MALWRLLPTLIWLAAFWIPVGLRGQERDASAGSSLQTVGDVYLDGKQAAGEQTVFSGEDIRTAGNGMAVLSIAETAVVNIASQTEIILGAPRGTITLLRGTAAVRSLQGGPGMAIQSGSLIARLPADAQASAAAMTVSLDGSVRIECLDGTVVVSRLQGTENVTLHIRQSLRIDAEGRFQSVETAPSMPADSSGRQAAAQSNSSKKSRLPYVILGGAAGVAGIGAAIALSHSNGQPVSPSSP